MAKTTITDVITNGYFAWTNSTKFSEYTVWYSSGTIRHYTYKTAPKTVMDYLEKEKAQYIAYTLHDEIKDVKTKIHFSKSYSENLLYRHHAIMLDCKTGDVWVDVFTTSNEWKNYHDKAIINLWRVASNYGMYSWSDHPITVEAYAKFCIKQYNEGSLRL